MSEDQISFISSARRQHPPMPGGTMRGRRRSQHGGGAMATARGPGAPAHRAGRRRRWTIPGRRRAGAPTRR